MKSSCPLCHSDDFSYVFKPLPGHADASVVKCRSCGHVYTKLTKPVDFASLYSDEVYEVVENRKSIFDKILSWEYRRVLRSAKKLLSPPYQLLDFGSGKGKLGSLAKEEGWEVKCVETSTQRATYAREIYGLDVSSDFFTSGQIFGMRFNLIALFHVLEHLREPTALLVELTQANLDRNGILLIEVPNIKSWQARLSGSRWMHLDVPRHINHFSPARLEKFMNALAFEPVRKSFFSFHLGVLGMTDSLLKLFGYKKNIIVELKKSKSKARFVPVLIVLPFAFMLEALASLFQSGGVIRMYLVKK